MWWRTSTASAVSGIGLMLLAAAGCTVSVQPWTKPGAGPAGMESGTPGFLPAGFQAPMPRPVPGPPAAPNNETMVQLIKQYNEADDHRKALQEQVQTFKKQLKDREDSLRLASHEMEESSTK